LALLHRYDESMAQFGKALQFDPQQPYVHERLGAVLLWQGKTTEAVDAFQKAANFSGRHPEKLAWLGYAYAVRGNRDEALRVLDEIKSNPRQQYVSPFHVAMLYAGLGEKDEAMRWLEKAYAQRDEWMVYRKIYPEFATLHDDRPAISGDRTPRRLILTATY
jgi:tetratricopeptide (TPR) repeat protein